MTANDRPQRPRQPAHDRKRSVGIAAGLALVAAVVVAAVTTTRGGGGASPPAAGTDGGVAHVHGLGQDPADGGLYAATHTGLFRIPTEGEATRIADRYQDTMGFTVAGPGRFLGSGHPDIDDRKLRRPGRPPLLGLIESPDAGETWDSVSLLGDVDFHALSVAHGNVYGFDATSGRFMVSRDRKSWETRSTIGMLGFAVDPTDADHVVAATGDGVIASVDGGRTWQQRPGPPLVVVSWDERSGLWGADPAGSVQRLGADGTWVRTGALAGQPQALLARDGTLYAAAGDDAGVAGIYRSTDGRDWDLVYRDSGS